MSLSARHTEGWRVRYLFFAFNFSCAQRTTTVLGTRLSTTVMSQTGMTPILLSDRANGFICLYKVESLRDGVNTLARL